MLVRDRPTQGKGAMVHYRTALAVPFKVQYQAVGLSRVVGYGDLLTIVLVPHDPGNTAWPNAQDAPCAFLVLRPASSSAAAAVALALYLY